MNQRHIEPSPTPQKGCCGHASRLQRGTRHLIEEEMRFQKQSGQISSIIVWRCLLAFIYHARRTSSEPRFDTPTSKVKRSIHKGSHQFCFDSPLSIANSAPTRLMSARRTVSDTVQGLWGHACACDQEQRSGTRHLIDEEMRFQKQSGQMRHIIVWRCRFAFIYHARRTSSEPRFDTQRPT